MTLEFLVVDDDAVDRRAACRAVKKAGFDAVVHEAICGDSAEDAVKSNRFHCILLDYRLPGASGYAVMERLKPHIEAHHTPIIIMTGLDSEAQSVDAISRGAHNFIQKTQMTAAILGRAITNAMENAELKRKTQEAETSLRQKQALLETAQEIARLGCWEYDLVKMQATWSAGVYGILALRPDEAQPGPETMQRHFDAETWSTFLAVRQQVIDENQQKQLTHEIIRASGDRRTVHHILQPIADHKGTVIRLAGTMQDVTEQIQSQKTLERAQRMEALGHFSGGIAHDFNNLLGIMTGHLGLLERSVKHEPALAKRVATLQHVTDRGARLVKRLLNFSRKSDVSTETVDVNFLLHDLREVLSKSLTAQVDLQLNLTDTVRPISVDPGDLEDAIINLTVNARDAMPDGGTLTFTTKNLTVANAGDAPCPALSPGDYVAIEVTDTGNGMPGHVLEHATEPFFSTKDKEKGSGLGLSMIYGFAKRSAGDLQLLSSVGKGTTACIYLPCSDDQTPLRDEKKSERVDRQPSAITTTILVVDDEPELVSVAEEVLGGCGYTTLKAANVDEAIKVLENKGDIDLVFSDVIMPGSRSGFDLATEISARWPRAKVLLTSGYASEKEPDGVPSHIVENILPKPYSEAQLTNRIQQLLIA